ncbi:MAG: hypothetical protein Q4F74_07110 [Synergistaceae bacterium]|nr:hypothetical protein [Synergistaceae bacterium]
MNTAIGHLKEFLMEYFYSDLGLLVVIICSAVFLISLFIEVFKPDFIETNRALARNIIGGYFWLSVRLASFLISIAVFTTSYDKHGLLLQYSQTIVLHTIPRLVILVVVLSITAPLLLDYGLVQFASVLASPIMRPLFKVPGRAAVDGMASWLGSSSMAVVLTAKMHERGYYNDREAAIMIAAFSLPGIYNIYAITDLFEMESYFMPILISVYVAAFILALILPRMWPLVYFPNTYHTGYDNFHKDIPDPQREYSLFERALVHAANKARRMNMKSYLSESLALAMPLLFETIPLMIAFGTPLMLIAEWTPLVKIAAMPITRLFFHFGTMEPEMLSHATVFAFIDQYLATAYGRALFTGEARFLCICLTTVGLINITEIGIHVWHSSIPMKFWHLLAIYVIRIIIAAVILIPIAEYLFLIT